MPRCFSPVWEGKPKQWGSLVTCSFLCALQPQHNRKRADLFPVPTASSRPQLGSPLCLPRYTHNSSPSFCTLVRSPRFLPPVKGCVWGGQEPSVQPGLEASQPQGWAWKRLASGAPSCLLHAAHQNAADLTVKMLFLMSNVNVLCCNLSKF